MPSSFGTTFIQPSLEQHLYYHPYIANLDSPSPSTPSTTSQCPSSPRPRSRSPHSRQNSYFTSQSGMHLRYFRDIPEASKTEMTTRKHANIQTNLGQGAHESDGHNLHGISLLTTLGCHDLSAMRDVIGMPKRCIASTRSRDAGGCSWWWTALFDYGSFKAHFEVSRKSRTWFSLAGKGRARGSERNTS